MILTGFAPLHPVDLRRTFALQAFGHFDPTARWEGDTLLKTFSAASGPCSVRIARAAAPQEPGLTFTVEGADAEAVMAELLHSAAAADGYESFAPTHVALAELHRQTPGLRLVRVPWLFDIACSAVLQQRVKSTDAMRDWARVASRYGQAACSRATRDGQCAFPSAKTLAAVPLHALIRDGIDPRRARTLLALAREIAAHPLRASLSLDHLRLRLSRIPGVGPWTTEMILGFGAADADAVPLGDLYLPHLVASTLAGESRATDERMLELLEPYRPQRFRVVRLVYAAQFSRAKLGSDRLL